MNKKYEKELKEIAKINDQIKEYNVKLKEYILPRNKLNKEKKQRLIALFKDAVIGNDDIKKPDRNYIDVNVNEVKEIVNNKKEQSKLLTYTPKFNLKRSLKLEPITVKKEKDKNKEISFKKYTINEDLAKVANDINSFRDYKKGSWTNDYLSSINSFTNKVKDLMEHYKDKIDDDKIEQVKKIVDRYSKNYAEAINKFNRIEAYYPSVMISGAGNFNTRKKNKQNDMRDNFFKNEGRIFREDGDEYYIKKIENLLNPKAIKASDNDVVDKIKEKIEKLRKDHDLVLDVAKHYKKYGNYDNYKDLTGEAKKYFRDNTGYLKYHAQRDLQEIRRLEGRLKELEKTKNLDSNKFTKAEGVKVVNDLEDMRIRLIFDDKPDDKTRELLKSSGFKWSPKNNAWQRQNTTNGIYATERVLKMIKEGL